MNFVFTLFIIENSHVKIITNHSRSKGVGNSISSCLYYKFERSVIIQFYKLDIS